jgi:hypothetical protein
MKAPWTPFRWPAAWIDPAAITLFEGSGIDFLVVDPGAEWEPVRARARQKGIRTAPPGGLPEDIRLAKGEWAGVHAAPGGGDEASSGPTGVPWVDSNGWKIRLEAALHPECAVWVDAAPPAQNFRAAAEPFLTMMADSAAYGGRWMVQLDPALALGMVSQNTQAMNIWKRIAAGAAYFAARKEWAGYAPVAVVGVVSDFAGDNEFLGNELLNLLARAGQHYRVVPKASAGARSFAGLRALLYADGQPPSEPLRKLILGFVESGGMLITGPKWGGAPSGSSGTPAGGEEHPRYTLRSYGKGRIAMANDEQDDPYVVANDSTILVSHRYDLVRFWNSGATGSFYAAAPDGKRAVVHLLFYANRGPDAASVRIAGRFTRAQASAPEAGVLKKVEVLRQKDALELHLPQVGQYVAIELE